MTLTRFEFTRRCRPLLEVGLGSTVQDAGVGVWDQSLWDAPTATWNGNEPLWRDVSCDAIDAHIELGRGRITDAFPVGTARVTVDNASGWADPSTAVDSVPGWVQFDGGAGRLTVPDAAPLDLAGDFCIVMRVLIDTAPVGNATIFTKGSPPDLAYSAGIFSSTDFLARVSTDGTAVGPVSYPTPGLPTAVGVWRWAAFAFDASDGDGGRRGSWWYGGDGDDPAAWQLIETLVVPLGAAVIFDSSADLSIGGFAGRLGHLSIRNGHGGRDGDDVRVGGSRVFEVDGWHFDSATVGASSITAATGQTVTVVESGGSTPTFVAAVNPAAESLLELRPGRPIRIGVQHATFGARWLFCGFIDEILPSDTPEDWSTVTFECIDALGEAGRAKMVSAVESGSGEQARTRFGRILDAIRWPSTKRSIASSAIRTLYAAKLDGQVVDLLRQTADSEGGWAFGDDQGRVVLKHRDWLYHSRTDPVDAVIGNDGGDDEELLLESGDDLLLEQSDEQLLESETADVCTSGWLRSFSRRDISTRVILDRDVPVDVDQPDPVQVDDDYAQFEYGIEPFEKSDLWTLSTGELQVNAGRILANRSAELSMPRISAVIVDAGAGVDPAGVDARVDLLAQLSVFTPSRYRGRLRTGRGVVFDDTFFAVGVTHDLSAEAWSAEISLDRTTPFAVLDDIDFTWDLARWDRSLWN